jgi:hypothetical protein
MSATPGSVMYAAARTLQFQTPPYERPASDEVLLVRRRGQPDGPPSEVWEFPRIGEFEYPAELEPWTDSVSIARVEAPFNPPDMPAADFQWISSDFARSCMPTAYDPAVPPALRRLDGPLLDQIMARIETLADSAINFKSGDIQVSTDTATRADFIEAQTKADRVAHAFGDSAPAPLAGERLHDYRVRLVAPYLKFSKQFKGADLGKVRDASAFNAVESQVYNDAAGEATHPTAASLRPGELRYITTMDAANRPITRSVGNTSACWDQFNAPYKFVRRFNTPGHT